MKNCGGFYDVLGPLNYISKNGFLKNLDRLEGLCSSRPGVSYGTAVDTWHIL